MSQRVSFPESTDRAPLVNAGFEVSLELPDGFSFRRRAASDLKYPVEIAAVANWDAPDTAATSGTPWDDWPRIDFMPGNGVLLWIVRGDVSYDNQILPTEVGWFDPNRQPYLPLRGSGSKSATTPAGAGIEPYPSQFGLSDSREFDEWPNATSWSRLMPLAGNSGQRRAAPPYLQIYGFAGHGDAPLQKLTDALTSIEVSSVS